MTIRKFVAALLCVFLLAGMMPATAIAAETKTPAKTAPGTVVMGQVSPLFEGMPDLSGRIHTASTASTGKSVAVESYYTTVEDAVAALRAGAMERRDSIVIGVTNDIYNNSMVYNLITAAYNHTGEPEAGDYLLWHWYSWTAYIYPSEHGVIIEYFLAYYTTAEEEAQVDAAVDALLAELNLWDATDYEKVKGVYDWICANVTYDYTAGTTASPLPYTAYGALIDGASVCQGYASLFYRLMLELGVDCRVVTGTVDGGDHAWNIVKVDGVYYNVDPTFDAAYLQGDAGYCYFLVSDLNFLDHVPDVTYTDPDFLAAYPKGEFNYDDSNGPALFGFCGAEGEYGENLIWILQNGILVIIGEGAMGDVNQYGMYWQNYKDHIIGVYVDEGVTNISPSAFSSMPNLADVYLSSTVKSIGENAFSNCPNLRTISFTGNAPEFDANVFYNVVATAYYPSGNETWTEEVMQNYGGIITWQSACLVHAYESVVTAPTCSDRGYTTHTCSVCGVVLVDTYTEKVGHAYESVVTAPTCIERGYTTHTCTFCGVAVVDTYTEKVGHAYESVVTAPTCTERGYTTHTCTVCGAGMIDTYTEKVAHPYESVVTAPTCSERGYTTHTCTVCGAVVVDTYTEKIPHAYKSVVTAPTCTAGGYTTHTCTVCADVMVDTYTEKAPHAYKSVVTAPTCTAGGYTTHTCTDCGDVMVDTYTEKAGHAYESIVTAAPNCTESGSAIYTCTVCGLSYDEILPAAHTYTNDQDTICDVCTCVRHVEAEYPENPPVVHMFRLYDPNSGEHFYTGSTEERDHLVSVGWNYEGVGFSFPVVGAPVYRLYDPVTGEHMYTMDIDEVNSLILAGWNNEGIAFNTAPETEVPQFRLHNPNETRGAYHFTSSTEERDNLLAAGWEYQGIGWYSCWK